MRPSTSIPKSFDGAVRALCLAVVLLTGCAGSENLQRRPTAPIAHDSISTPNPKDVDEDQLRPARTRVLAEVERWKGTRYRYGGTGKNGFDCSGFVSRVFQDALKVSLPRTTRALMGSGATVKKEELQFADLVFFYTPARADHVGIYIGDGEFAHASSSSGVMISHLDEDYWRSSYRGARRPVRLEPPSPSQHASGAVGEVVQPAEPTTTLPHRLPQKPETRRIGW